MTLRQDQRRNEAAEKMAHAMTELGTPAIFKFGNPSRIKTALGWFAITEGQANGYWFVKPPHGTRSHVYVPSTHDVCDAFAVREIEALIQRATIGKYRVAIEAKRNAAAEDARALVNGDARVSFRVAETSGDELPEDGVFVVALPLEVSPKFAGELKTLLKRYQ